MRITAFTGLDTLNPESEVPIAGAVVADNVDFTRGGKVRRRLGRDRVASLGVSAAWSDGRTLLLQSGTTLYRVEDAQGTMTALAQGLAASESLCAVEVNGRLYWSNGTNTGVIDGSQSRAWGMPTPTGLRIAQTAGFMPSGTYMVAMSQVREDGYESGIGPAQFVTLTDGGIVVYPPAGSEEAAENVLYLSSADGDVMFEAARAPATEASIRYTADTASLRLPARYAFTEPPPAGHLMCYYRGRIYIAQGPVVWATRPMDYERIDPRSDYLLFDAPTTLLEAVEDGIYIATTGRTQFMAGADIAEFQARHVADYGAIPGTSVRVQASQIGKGDASGDAILWASERGLCAGFNGGQSRNLTERRVALPQSASGCAVLREVDGQTHYVAAVRAGLPFTGRRSFNTVRASLSTLAADSTFLTGEIGAAEASIPALALAAS